MMMEHGLRVDHSTLARWVLVYAPELEKRVKAQLKPTSDSWKTVTRWLERAGGQSVGWHGILFQGLKLALVQMDELCVRVRGLEKRRWLWLAVDPVSKALPSLH